MKNKEHYRQLLRKKIQSTKDHTVVQLSAYQVIDQIFQDIEKAKQDHMSREDQS